MIDARSRLAASSARTSTKIRATSLSLGSDLHKVSLSIANVGLVPTYGTRQALSVHPAPHLMVEVQAEEPIEFIIGSPRTQVGHLARGRNTG